MKQQLWVLNSALAALFITCLLTLSLLHKRPPQLVRMKAVTIAPLEEKKEPAPAGQWDSIFKNDLFGTYTPPAEPKPVKTSLISPVPQPRVPTIEPAPEIKRQEFIDPLILTIKGIIIASHEDKNVAMIEDETKKESLYRLGDRYKDAQIIKIARNSVIFLRANGQQEVFYLRKEDADLALEGPDRWQYIIKKIDDQNWHIDPDNFKFEVESLGNFLERLNVLGVAYQKGTPLGLRIGEATTGSLGEFMGLAKGDIIISINDISVAQQKNRMKIYDMLTALRVDATIKVIIKRGQENVEQYYKLVKMNRAKQTLFNGDNKPAPSADATLNMSKAQEREKQDREFAQRHSPDQQQENVSQVRKRLLENLRARLQGARIR